MTNRQKAHWSFWIVGIFMLLWNLSGCINFLAQLRPDIVMQMPESHQAIILARPLWATIGFALAVFGGALGCILLMAKRSAALYMFAASFFGVFIQLLPNLLLVGTAIHNPFEIIMMIVLPPLVALFLIFYSQSAVNKNWIG